MKNKHDYEAALDWYHSLTYDACCGNCQPFEAKCLQSQPQDKAIQSALEKAQKYDRLVKEVFDDWFLKDNDFIPTSKKEKDLANYGWNSCVYSIRKYLKEVKNETPTRQA